ncbi:MAG TPA: HEAT repeat domain-containing protein [Gemmatimonadales bacterium]|nr:HEAT repeat domain-containing protein [Gemmatimonadales bacterium]
MDLFRDSSAKEAQKSALRALMALVQLADVLVETRDGVLFINGSAVPGDAYKPLVERLVLHGVRHIEIPMAAPPADLFNLLKSLADQPGAEDVPTRLRSGGTQRVSVAMSQLFAGDADADVGLPQGDVLVEHAPVLPDATPSAAPALDLGTGGLLHGELDDVRSTTPMDVGPITRDVPPPPATVAPPPPPPQSSEPEIERQSLAASVAPIVPAKAGDDDVLAQLERSPQSANVGDLLAVVARQVETAIKADRLERALKMLAAVVRLEAKVADAPRRTYGIALKRMFNKPLLQGVAHLLDYPAQREDGALVLQRAGADGVEVLLDILVAAPTVVERRGAFDALTRMKQGTDQLVHMLSHPQWFVVRNIAELVGELGLEDAVPALAKQVGHEDERVRKAVALALAKIATPTCAEPLRRALRDKSPVVRMQVALGIGGRKSGALAMPLVVALEEEKDPEVERELILALGRIASPDAVQALIKFAQPSGRLFGRKPTPLRVAAVEALRLAATPAALGTLQGLAGDSDRQVKAAAQAAVVELNKKATAGRSSSPA